MKIIAGAREELSPVQIRDHIVLSVEVKEIFLTTYVDKRLLRVQIGKQINVSDLKKALKDMKVEVTDKEYLNLVKTLPVDGKDFKIIYVFFKWL